MKPLKYGTDLPSWWKDWRGECVAIIASGPSVKKEDVLALRDRCHVVAIKHNVRLAPWADIVYGCDFPWWRHVRGLPDFKGLRLCYEKRAAARFPDIQTIEIKKQQNSLCFDNPGVVGSGSNSGFQALNLVAQFGATGIILVGFDMNENHGNLHWYGRNTFEGMGNPGPANFARWRAAFENASAQLKERNVDVVNTSTISALRCFRRASVTQALTGWGL